MKQFFLFAVLAFLVSCSGGNRGQALITDVAYELDALLTVADQKVENTVTVVGYVTHTCKHSGKKCFIIGESQATTLRVEIDPDGEIDMFAADLVGSKLAITGILKEEHISEEVIDGRESHALQLQQEGIALEACAAELSNLSEWRKWMVDNNKDYYVMYYMDGLKYQLLN